MIRDAHGKKMSKSLGNVLNPYDVIHGISLEELQASLEYGNLDPRELSRAKASQAKDFPSGIPECGTDALRFALLAYTSQARDINLDVLRVKGYRNFCNKLWQAFRYCQMFGLSEALSGIDYPLERDKLSATDRWILSRLAFAVTELDSAFKENNLASATTIAYRFWLYELCDVYIEYTKQFRNTARQTVILRIVYECMEVGLRLLHPMMPFITEELFQRIPRRTGNTEESIMVSAYPLPADYSAWRDIELEKSVELANEVTKRIRSRRKEMNIPDKKMFLVACRSFDDCFCRDFLMDIILPLSNCREAPGEIANAQSIVSNDKLQILGVNAETSGN